MTDWSDVTFKPFCEVRDERLLKVVFFNSLGEMQLYYQDDCFQEVTPEQGLLLVGLGEDLVADFLTVEELTTELVELLIVNTWAGNRMRCQNTVHLH